MKNTYRMESKRYFEAIHGLAKNVKATGAGSARPVVSSSTVSNFEFFSRARLQTKDTSIEGTLCLAAYCIRKMAPTATCRAQPAR
jgi:hypothetical protein